MLTRIRIDQRGADHRKHPPTCKTYSTGPLVSARRLQKARASAGTSIEAQFWRSLSTHVAEVNRDQLCHRLLRFLLSPLDRMIRGVVDEQSFNSVGSSEAQL